MLDLRFDLKYLRFDLKRIYIAANLRQCTMVPGTATVRRHRHLLMCQTAKTANIGAKLLIGRPFVKRFALCYRSVVLSVCLSVYDVHALWPNGWTDQDETWHAGKPRPWPHCVRWGPRSPPPKGQRGTASQFSAHICCGQMAAWIKMSLGMELGLGPGDFVLNGDPKEGTKEWREGRGGITLTCQI